MASNMRFGRRLALPSTRQIRHELLTIAAKEDAKLKTADLAKRDADLATPSVDPDVSDAS